jgi:hypothetical protein
MKGRRTKRFIKQKAINMEGVHKMIFVEDLSLQYCNTLPFSIY